LGDQGHIHNLAVVHPKAELGPGVTVAPFSVIEEGVRIGAGTTIGSNVLVAEGTVLGESCTIHHGAVVGSLPQDRKFRGEETSLEIGDRTVIREYATLNRGTQYSGRTKIGNDCLIMAYVHVAHDSCLGDYVILANTCTLAGHVVVEDYARLSGFVPVLQFTRIGRHSFVAGACRVYKDVPPYMKVAGDPLKVVGLNTGQGKSGPTGLEQHGISREAIEHLKQAYRILYRSNLNTSQAVQRIREELDPTPEIDVLLKFIETSERGIVR